ncbi:MAG TPA: universal stress protein [Desulfonatronum sp.]|nr:universal stress protein [Desulfonatronum sp.]
MSRNLLVTISEDPAFLHGVRFIIHFFTPAPDLHLDLVLMPPKDSVGAVSKALPPDKALGIAETMFSERGFNVSSPSGDASLVQCETIAELADIAGQGHYDAVALGRRGAARLAEYLASRYKENNFDKNLDFPFWICREPDLTRENVLLCIDGSRQGLCAADHVGFMCQNESRHSVCVLYFCDPQRRDRHDEELIIENTLLMLRANDIPDDRISIKILAEKDHAQGILREAEQGRYAVVAVGRSGTGRGMMDQRQFGSVSLRLARTLSKASLWVCAYPC